MLDVVFYYFALIISLKIGCFTSCVQGRSIYTVMCELQEKTMTFISIHTVSFLAEAYWEICVRFADFVNQTHGPEIDSILAVIGWQSSRRIPYKTDTITGIVTNKKSVVFYFGNWNQRKAKRS